MANDGKTTATACFQHRPNNQHKDCRCSTSNELLLLQVRTQQLRQTMPTSTTEETNNGRTPPNSITSTTSTIVLFQSIPRAATPLDRTDHPRQNGLMLMPLYILLQHLQARSSLLYPKSHSSITISIRNLPFEHNNYSLLKTHRYPILEQSTSDLMGCQKQRKEKTESMLKYRFRSSVYKP